MAIIDWLDVELVEALAQALIHSLWQGVLIVSLLLVGDQLGIIDSSERKYLFYLTGLILLFVSSIISFFSAFYWPHEVQSDTILTPFNSLIYQHPTVESTGSTAFFWQGALVLAWFAGFLYHGCKNVFGIARLFHLRARAQNAPMHWQRRVREMSRLMHIKSRTILLSTKDVTIPFVMGVLRPVIMFPANYFVQLAPAQIEAILIHELAHIGRNDYLLNIIQIIIESLLFFNPATWWLSKQIRRQREYCCDDRVTTNLNDQGTYLEALYNVARFSTKHPAPAVALFDNNSELIMRMKRMSSTYQPQKSVRSMVVASIGLLTVFGLFAFNTIEKRNANSTDGFLSGESFFNSGDKLDLKLNLDKAINLSLLNAKLSKIDILDRQLAHLVDEQQAEGMAMSAIQHVTSLPLFATIASAVADEIQIAPSQHAISDTNPPSPRMLELQAKMEAKAEEMEELAEELEEIIESTVEAEVEKIEALAEEMELIAEQYESQIEDSPEMQRLEELSDILDDKMEAMEDELEEMQDDVIEELEELIESKSEQYEEYESLSQEQREKLATEMKTLSEELRVATGELNEQYMQVMESPEIKALQEEMQQLSIKVSQAHLNMEPMNEEMQRLQVEMQKQQQVMHEKMNGNVEELQKKLQLKAEEMEQLQMELQQEMELWHQGNKKKD